MIVQVENVSKNFGQVKVLKNVNLTINQGEHCSLVGASGSGKSTLLYLLGGMDIPTQGKILIDGNDLSELDDDQLAHYRNHHVGFVFQFHFLLPSMKCMDNILLPVKIANQDIKQAQQMVQALAEKLQVQHCLNKYPFELSGGEQQRVNLIRSVILKPGLLLCDEPTGNLDSKNSAIVIELLKSLATQSGATLIVVTHNEKIAASFSRKITIEDGQIIS